MPDTKTTKKKLVNTQYPYLKVYVPDLKEYRQFEGGLLVIEPDDPAYDHMLGWAGKDPNTSIHSASAKVENEPETTTQVKAASPTGLVCDVCQPAQAFGSEEALAEHNLALHAVKPQVDDGGNVKEASPRAQVTKGAAKTS